MGVTNTHPMDRSPEAGRNREAETIHTTGMRYLDLLHGTRPGTAEDDEDERADLTEAILDCSDRLNELGFSDLADELERDLGTKR